MRRPDFAGGRIESDGFGVGHVVAELRGFAVMNDGGRNVEGTNGELGAAELLDGRAIVFAALLRGFFGVATFEGAVGFVAGNKKKGDVGENAKKNNRRIEVRILEDGPLRSIGVSITWRSGADFTSQDTEEGKAAQSEELIRRGIRGVEGGDELVGLLNGIVDAFGEGGDVGIDLGGSAFQGADGAGIEIVFEEENLVLKGLKDGSQLAFGFAHGGHVRSLALFGIAEHGGALRFEFGVAHLVDFGLPFLEEIIADLIDGLDAVVKFVGLPLGVFILRVELFVGLFEIAALEAGEFLEGFEGGLEFLLGLFLIFLGIDDALDEDVALFLAEGFHGFVVGGLAGSKEGAKR